MAIISREKAEAIIREQWLKDGGNVSIHAPVKGATRGNGARWHPTLFQSTRP